MNDSTGGWDVETDAPEPSGGAAETPHDPAATLERSDDGHEPQLEGGTEAPPAVEGW